MSIRVPEIKAIEVYKRPSPKKYKEIENGSNIAVLMKIYLAVLSFPIKTGNMGTLALA
jgi:hypothetical protein